MADKRDYYEVLGVQKGASEDEIKKAYRQSAKNTIPTFTPATRTARRSSRRSTRLTRCFPTAKSARAMTSSATRA